MLVCEYKLPGETHLDIYIAVYHNRAEVTNLDGDNRTFWLFEDMADLFYQAGLPVDRIDDLILLSDKVA